MGGNKSRYFVHGTFLLSILFCGNCRSKRPAGKVITLIYAQGTFADLVVESSTYVPHSLPASLWNRRRSITTRAESSFSSSSSLVQFRFILRWLHATSQQRESCRCRSIKGVWLLARQPIWQMDPCNSNPDVFFFSFFFLFCRGAFYGSRRSAVQGRPLLLRRHFDSLLILLWWSVSRLKLIRYEIQTERFGHPLVSLHCGGGGGNGCAAGDSTGGGRRASGHITSQRTL